MTVATFVEKYVEADGFRIRYLEGGEGEPLVYFHGATGMRVARCQELLAERYRVIVFEVPGFGESPVNDRSASLPELALTMGRAVANLGMERYNLAGFSFGGDLALRLTIQEPDRIQALVLIAPSAIRPEGLYWTTRSSDARASVYAHPERQPPGPRRDPTMQAKHDALIQRLEGPPRDPELEAGLSTLNVPVLVLFGTLDRMIPPEMGRIYREKLPNCHFILVHDAGHAIDVDRPEALAAAVGEFLAYREAFIVNRESGLIHP